MLDGRERRDHQGLENGVGHRPDHQDGESQPVAGTFDGSSHLVLKSLKGWRWERTASPP